MECLAALLPAGSFDALTPYGSHKVELVMEGNELPVQPAVHPDSVQELTDYTAVGVLPTVQDFSPGDLATTQCPAVALRVRQSLGRLHIETHMLAIKGILRGVVEGGEEGSGPVR